MKKYYFLISIFFFSFLIFVSYNQEERLIVDSKLEYSDEFEKYFRDITYNETVWLPGTDSLGVFDGSVSTYGVWTAKNSQTGNVVIKGSLKSVSGKMYLYEILGTESFLIDSAIVQNKSFQFKSRNFVTGYY